MNVLLGKLMSESDTILIAREEFSPTDIIYLKDLVARDYAVLKHYPNNVNDDAKKVRDAEQILLTLDRMIQKYHTYQSATSNSNINKTQ